MKKQETEQEKTGRFIAWNIGMCALGFGRHTSAVLDEGRTRAAGRTCLYQKIEITDERGVLSLVVDNPSCIDHEGAAFVATARLVGLAALAYHQHAIDKLYEHIDADKRQEVSIVPGAAEKKP